MAIIKCPECGHQISDKAPVCPSCGVEIAGKVTKCPNCGEVYFKDQEMCPNCHRPTYTSQPPIPPTSASQASAYSQGTAYSQASTSQSQASTIPPTPQSTTRLSGTPTPPPIGANAGNTYGGNGPITLLKERSWTPLFMPDFIISNSLDGLWSQFSLPVR